MYCILWVEMVSILKLHSMDTHVPEFRKKEINYITVLIKTQYTCLVKF